MSNLWNQESGVSDSITLYLYVYRFKFNLHSKIASIKVFIRMKKVHSDDQILSAEHHM